MSFPFVSKPTPIPSKLESIRNSKVSMNSLIAISDGGFIIVLLPYPPVLTNAQLFNAAYSSFSYVSAVPIAHNPLPGGKNFMLNILSNILMAYVDFTISFHCSPFLMQCLFCMVKQPSTTLLTVSCHLSYLPPRSSLTLA